MTESDRRQSEGSMPLTRTAYHKKPDYSRPAFRLPEDAKNRMLDRLTFLYGATAAKECMVELDRMLRVHLAHKPLRMIEAEKNYDPKERFIERDVILITYGDLLKSEGVCPLKALADFCDSALMGAINTIHILPFFPSSSDRGFSVIDFESVDPNLGTWEDIEELEGRYQLMFDGVINHISSESVWFREFLNGHPRFRDFFTAYDSPDELSPQDRALIFRPRTSDILTEFLSIDGPKFVWTTFSRDQIDLNYKNPDVLLHIFDVLLKYIRKGADILRLDAVTYLWEEAGTRSIHMEQTHQIVKLFRDVLDAVGPWTALITETNVPHEENISYFGNGHDEAQMVYNFALPPLVLHTFYTGDVTALSGWARTLKTPSDTTTFFNFLDSHDGVGLMGASGILTPEEIDRLIAGAKDHGGLVSYKSAADGSDVPYEINITWYSALNKEDSDETMDLQVKRFTASRAVALVLEGVPAIYLHGLLGTENDCEAVTATRSKRAINRTFIDAPALYRNLADPASKVARINKELGRLLRIRTDARVFHPQGPQRVLDSSPRVFCLMRSTPEEDRHVVTLTNVTKDTIELNVPVEDLGFAATGEWLDLVAENRWMADGGIVRVRLEPYGVLWLEPLEQEAAV